MTNNSSKLADNQPSKTVEKLIKHSYDMIVFPRYLELLSPHVQLRIKDKENGCDVYAIYLDETNKFSYKFGQFISNTDGMSTTSTKIYTGIHEAFRSANTLARYIGFRGCGRIPIGPLMHIGFMYTRYGRGIFQDGEILPTPCQIIESQYSERIDGFRTDAPLKTARKIG